MVLKYVFLLSVKNIKVSEFAPLCEVLIGKQFAIAIGLTALFAVGGACMVYWVLMSTFAFDTVTFGYGKGLSFKIILTFECST